ncbi:MAG: hypothetical protein R6V05_12015 [Candidatus Brocadiia bacterium]
MLQPADEQNAGEHGLENLGALFATALWAFPFFLHIRVPVLHVLPDVGGWVVALVAVLRLRAPEGRVLRRTAAAGLVLSLCRITVFRLTGSETALFTLHAPGLLAAVVFVWGLCGLVASAARERDYGDLQRRAVWGRRLFIVHASLAYGGGLALRVVGGGLIGLVAVLIVTLASALILSYVMALLASAARMCRVELRAESSGQPA